MNVLTWKWGRYLSAGLASPGPSVPAPVPEEPVHPPVAPGPPPKPRKWRTLVLVLLIVAAVVVWNARRRQAAVGQGKAGPGAIRTAKVFTGVLDKTLRVNGTVAAKNFAAIVAPQMRGRERGGGGGGGDRGASMGGSQLTLIKLAPPGSHVKKGEVIAEFDTQSELEHIDDHRARVIQTQAIVDKRRAEIAIESEAHQQLLRTTRAENEKAQLDLRTAEVRSAIDAEKLKLSVEETAARYKQIQEEVRLKKTSQQAEIRGLEMQVQQEQHHVDRHTRNIQRMSMKAPIDGLVVMQTIYRSGQFGQVQEGDQVFPGTYFMDIVDLSEMVVNGSVNQADSHLITLGQPATIHLDAYPDLALPGRVRSLGAMATGESGGRGRRGPRGGRDNWVKQIPVTFSIDAKDGRLIPDLSASGDVRLKTAGRVLQVAREAVIEENGKTYARVRQGQGFEKREIQIGMESNTHTVVLAGLTEGEEVALDHP